jgi:hypothetical protein
MIRFDDGLVIMPRESNPHFAINVLPVIITGLAAATVVS